MIPEIVTIEKSLERRLAEYHFLTDSAKPCSEVYHVWGDVLSLNIGHFNHWRALWQLSEQSSIQFKTVQPIAVVVSVEEVLVEELSAKVVVEWTQEDMVTPSRVEVPIFELFPLKYQNISLEYVEHIADVIDQCRFFLLNLWYPWDNVEDIALSEWCEKHLENRVNLQYEIMDSECNIACLHVKGLMTEALQVNDALEDFEEQAALSSDTKLPIVKNLLKKEDIKLQLSLFEDPELREAMVMFTNEYEDRKLDVVGIVIPKTNATIACSFLRMAETHVSEDEEIAIYNSAQKAVKLCKTVFLSPGRYKLERVGRILAFSGTIRGLSAPIETIVTPVDRCPGPYHFLTSFNWSFFQNITLERYEGLLLTVAEGVMRVHDCLLRGSEEKSATGIVVMPGCRLELVNCELSSLGTAVLVKQGGTILLNSCRIRNCNEGIKIMDNCTATLEGIEVESCATAGIVVQSSENGDDTSGPLDLLSAATPRNWFVSFSECSFKNNAVDAFIVRAPHDLLSD